MVVWSNCLWIYKGSIVKATARASRTFLRTRQPLGEAFSLHRAKPLPMQFTQMGFSSLHTHESHAARYNDHTGLKAGIALQYVRTLSSQSTEQSHIQFRTVLPNPYLPLSTGPCSVTLFAISGEVTKTVRDE